MKKIIKNIERFKNSNDGVAGVVIAVLLVGLFLSFIAFIQAVYVPQWIEQEQAKHMGDIGNQFAHLKFSIDTLSITNQPNSQISIPMTLGTDEISFMKSIRSYGSLNVLPNDYKITIIEKDDDTSSYILGSLKYDSQNTHYIDQSYTYENGALILSQAKGDVMVIQPSLSVVDAEDLSFELIKLVGFGNKTSASGYGTYPVKTKYYNSFEKNIYNVEKIKIQSQYTSPWKKFINDTFINSALNFSVDDTNLQNEFIITFYDTDDANLPKLELKVTEIEIQISPGWVS